EHALAIHPRRELAAAIRRGAELRREILKFRGRMTDEVQRGHRWKNNTAGRGEFSTGIVRGPWITRCATHPRRRVFSDLERFARLELERRGERDLLAAPASAPSPYRDRRLARRDEARRGCRLPSARHQVPGGVARLALQLPRDELRAITETPRRRHRRLGDQG